MSQLPQTNVPLINAGTISCPQFEHFFVSCLTPMSEPFSDKMPELMLACVVFFRNWTTNVGG